MIEKVLDIVVLLCFFVGVGFVLLTLNNVASVGFQHLTFDSLEHSVMLICNASLIAMAIWLFIFGYLLYCERKK
jgi:hypothetical protein